MPAMNLNLSTGNLSTQVQTWLEKQFLTILRSNLVLAPLAKKKKLMRGQGNILRFHRYLDLAAQTTALTQGTTPDGMTIDDTNVDITLNQYGGYFAVSDFISMVAINDPLKGGVDLIGRNAALSIDSIVRNTIDNSANGFNARYADAANNSSEANVEAGADELGSAEVRAAVERLHSQNAPPYDDGLFRGVIHPFNEANLIGESAAGTAMEFLKYTESDPMRRWAIGTLYGVRFYRSSNIRAVSPNNNTYRCLFFGKDAFGVVDHEQGDTEMILKPTGSAGSEDPLNQRATLGWKATFGVGVLEGARGVVMAAYGA